MIYPTMIVDNFFDNPDEVSDYANTLQFNDTEYIVGKRTDFLHNINRNLYEYTVHKILTILYPYDTIGIKYQADSYFQKSSIDSRYDSWIHTDKCEITAMIYLTKGISEGTNLYKRKSEWLPTVNNTNGKFKHESFKNKKFDKEYEDLKLKTNSDFDLTTNIKGLYNRLALFDGSNYHAMEQKNNDDERLIMIFFIYDLQGKNLRNGLVQSKRYWRFK
tara:strand:+ start:274 stop:927 length:654 start_codon:yes stop_codon:yes gene_type:complete